MVRSVLIVAGVLSLGFAARLWGAEPVKLNGHSFTLPDGFTIELVTSMEHTKRPIAATFDHVGNLYVTEASGTNDPVVKQVVDKPHTILKLTDTDGDGKFDRSIVYSDKLMLPQGIMWLNGSIYVGTPPTIEKLTDTDNDGKADKRETWFDGKTLTGCANDLHGPYLGPDGWIYWTKGAFAKQTHTLGNGKKFETRASHIFRAKPDGTGLDVVMTGGMDNPVDVAFSATGERFFTTTFLQHPAGGKRDGIIHAVYGGVYGKDHDPVNEHPQTGPELLPPMTHLGAAAPCGLHRLESDQFGDDYKDNLFAACFNMHKVTRHQLVSTGSTYTTKDFDFLTSDNVDFHPTDVIEDADGSLLVIDTGGWYKLCCPTSVLVKPDVFGGIYRIRKAGSHKVSDPRGTKIDWKKTEDLAKWLDDPRPAVRQRAIEQLGANPTTALPILEKLLRESKSPLVRQNALWAAARFDLSANRTVHAGPGQPQVLLTCLNMARSALSDEDKPVRLVALHLISLYRDKYPPEDIVKLLVNGSPHERRCAAEAIGRLGFPITTTSLFDSLKQPSDRIFEHAVIYALIERHAEENSRTGLLSGNASVRRAAMIALDQMPNAYLFANRVIDEFESENPSNRAAAAWILKRRPEMAKVLIPAIEVQLERPVSQKGADGLIDRLVLFAGNVEVQRLMGDFLHAKPAPNAGVVLRAMSKSGLKTLPESWIDGLVAILKSDDAANIGLAVAAVRSFPIGKSFSPKLSEALASVALQGKHLYEAYDAIPGGLTNLTDEQFQRLLEPIQKKDESLAPVAASVLSKANLKPDQLRTLSTVLSSCGPMELAKLTSAFAKSTDETAGLALVKALDDPKLRSSLRSEVLKPILEKYPQSVKTAAEPLFAKLESARAGERKKLEDLIVETKGGDVRRGHAVFNNAKAACISCHSMGYLGGKTGPDLSKIGGVRTERDLLEAIVFPNASFVRSYEPVKLVTTDGRTLTGILKKDAPDEVILSVNATEEVRVLRTDIESLVPGTVSVMPSGLDQQLTKQDLADLIAFLKASK